MGLAPLEARGVVSRLRRYGARDAGDLHAETDVCGEVLHHEVGHVVAEGDLSS